MRILLAEDHPQLREGTRRFLERMGHEVHVACDGKEALDAATNHSFDLVVSDLEMPRMSGMELYEALPSPLQHRFILHSGNAEALSEINTRIRVILKGSPLSELKNVVQELLGGMATQ